VGSETGSAGDFRNRWYQKVTKWQKASDLVGKDAHNTKNEDIGKMSDLVVDPDGGRILYGILSFHGKLFPVPFNAMNLTFDGKKVILDINKELLKDSIAFTDREWPNMVDANWSTEVHTVYNVQPYWVTIERTKTEKP
jgi:sporulation protein YlmC with PRC-barrel domain